MKHDRGKSNDTDKDAFQTPMESIDSLGEKQLSEQSSLS